MTRTLALLLILLASPAVAQDVAQPVPAPTAALQPDEDAAESAPPQPQIERPYEAPPAEPDPVYVSRVQGRIGAAQSQRGPLDGGWILTDASGAQLYHLQFSETPQNGLEGAWRDLRRGGVSTLGVIDEVAYADGALTAVIPGREAGQSARLTLRAIGEGWAGEMSEGGVIHSVAARRDPLSAAWDSYTPAGSARPFVAASATSKAAPVKATTVKKKAVKRKATGKRGKAAKRKKRR
ncbi:hypothetical protein [Caulobacter sp. NIBR2454]|uniref:hypothetical protein n=1 Tax=Caulobacter sp. NIBR2454 TaxID=3015996 RepID=UPI0022B6E84E|nr:hypothetical protein [Caulobacter sp. NIBR2454]